MSGTSMDGIDGALLETDGQDFVRELGFVSLSYDKTFKVRLKQAEQTARHGAEISYSVIDESTKLHAQVVHALLEKTGRFPKEIQVVGYHGQTLYHEPSQSISIIVGDGALLSQLTGIPVVNNFRAQDMALGGQGAPLAPIYHLALAKRDGHIPAVVVNFGGIANVTLIPSSAEQDLIAFDTGPANGLIDRIVFSRTNGVQCMDVDGLYASSGCVHDSILDKLFSTAVIKDGQNYFELPSPKALDTSHLHLIPELDSLNLEDACATLAAFTALSLVRGVVALGLAIPKTWILAGGGVKNPAIVTHLRKYLLDTFGSGVKILTAENVGWQAQALEAQLFAYLAVRHIYNLPLSFPKTTGVSVQVCGGNLWAPQGHLMKKQ